MLSIIEGLHVFDIGYTYILGSHIHKKFENIKKTYTLTNRFIYALTQKLAKLFTKS